MNSTKVITQEKADSGRVSCSAADLIDNISPTRAAGAARDRTPEAPGCRRAFRVRVGLAPPLDYLVASWGSGESSFGAIRGSAKARALSASVGAVGSALQKSAAQDCQVVPTSHPTRSCQVNSAKLLKPLPGTVITLPLSRPPTSDGPRPETGEGSVGGSDGDEFTLRRSDCGGAEFLAPPHNTGPVGPSHALRPDAVVLSHQICSMRSA